MYKRYSRGPSVQLERVLLHVSYYILKLIGISLYSTIARVLYLYDIL
jgi:hypothetical protein